MISEVDRILYTKLLNTSTAYYCLLPTAKQLENNLFCWTVWEACSGPIGWDRDPIHWLHGKFYMVSGQLPFDSYVLFCPHKNGRRFFTFKGESNAELLLLVLILVLGTIYITGMYYPYFLPFGRAVIFLTLISKSKAIPKDLYF